LNGGVVNGTIQSSGCQSLSFTVPTGGFNGDLSFRFDSTTTGLSAVYISNGNINDINWRINYNANSTTNVPGCSFVGGNTYFVAIEAAYLAFGSASYYLQFQQVPSAAVVLTTTTTTLTGTLRNGEFNLYRLPPAARANQIQLSGFGNTRSDGTTSSTSDTYIYVSRGVCPDLFTHEFSYSAGNTIRTFQTRTPLDALYVLVTNSRTTATYNVTYTGTINVAPVVCAPYRGSSCDTPWPTAVTSPVEQRNADGIAGLGSLFCGLFPTHRARNVICGASFPACDPNNFALPACASDCTVLVQDCGGTGNCNSTSTNCFSYANGAPAFVAPVTFFTVLIAFAAMFF